MGKCTNFKFTRIQPPPHIKRSNQRELYYGPSASLFGITSLLTSADGLLNDANRNGIVSLKTAIQHHKESSQLSDKWSSMSSSSSQRSGNTWKKTALLVVDMQNDFILPDGAVHLESGLSILPNVIKAVEVARQRGILVIWVVREHDPQGRDVELMRKHLYSVGSPKPASKGSVGAELVDGLMVKEEDYKLVKTRFSAFFGTHLHFFLQGAGIESLILTGVQTPNCVRQTVFDAIELDYRLVSVIVDATAAATPNIHAANILDMKNVGVSTPTLQEWITGM